MRNRLSFLNVCWRQGRRTTVCLIIFLYASSSQLLWSLLLSSRVLVISDIAPDVSFLFYSNQESLHNPGTNKTHSATEDTTKQPLSEEPSSNQSFLVSGSQDNGPRSKRLYMCGFPGDHMNFLFPEHILTPFPRNPDALLHDASVSDDILILVGGGYKPTCAESWTRAADFVQFRSKFPGKILVTNGESTGISAAPETQNNTYRLGNYKPDARSMRVTFCQLTLLTYGPAVWPKITDPSLRPKGTKERFVIYAASNCKPFRQEAAMRLADIGVVELGGRCRISHSQNEHVQEAPAVIRKADWSQNHEHFRSYRFCLVMENEYVAGYVTEKILNAFLAGCIPIYYGSRPDVLAMFNEKAFVFYDVKNPKPALARIRELEKDSDAYDTVMKEPILANGTQTVEEYFSFTNDIENGSLAKRIREMMGLINPLVKSESSISASNNIQ